MIERKSFGYTGVQKPMENYQKADTERLLMPPNQHPCTKCGYSFFYDGVPPVNLCADCQDADRMVQSEHACSICNQGFRYLGTLPVNICPACQANILAGTRPLPATVDGGPRRNNALCWTGAEIAIHNAMASVETAGAHPLLTEATTLLCQAADRVADYYEMPEPKPAPSVSESCQVIREKFDELEAIPHKWTPEALEKVKALTKQIEELTLQLSRSMGAGEGKLK